LKDVTALEPGDTGNTGDTGLIQKSALLESARVMREVLMYRNDEANTQVPHFLTLVARFNAVVVICLDFGHDSLMVRKYKGNSQIVI